MMDEIRHKLETLFQMRMEIIDIIKDKIDGIKENVCLEKCNYATAFDFLGLFCPSLVEDIITGGYKKGRILKNKPNSKKYVKCYYDKKGHLLYFEKFNEFGCSYTFYFLRVDNVIYIAPFIGHSKNEYPTYVYNVILDDEHGVKEYSKLTSNSITYEHYKYIGGNESICYRYYYVPKNINLLQQARIHLYLNNKKVVRLNYYEIEGNQERLTYFFEK